jgi:hypothetical protein
MEKAFGREIEMIGYELIIECVDSSVIYFKTDDKNQLLPFLKRHDREGSSITLIARMDNFATSMNHLQWKKKHHYIDF